MQISLNVTDDSNFKGFSFQNKTVDFLFFFVVVVECFIEKKKFIWPPKILWFVD